MIRDYAKVSCNNISKEANYKTEKTRGCLYSDILKLCLRH